MKSIFCAQSLNEIFERPLVVLVTMVYVSFRGEK